MNITSSPAREELGEDPRPGRTHASFTRELHESPRGDEHASLLPAAEQRYRILLSALAERVWRLEFPRPLDPASAIESLVGRILREGRVSECNPPHAHATKSRGPCACSCIGMRLGDLVLGTHDEQRAIARRFIQDGFHTVDLESIEWDESGHPIGVSTNLIGIFERGRLTGVWGAQRASISGVRLSHNPRPMSQHASDLVVILAADGQLAFMSPALEDVLLPEPGTTRPRDFLGHVHPEDLAALQSALEEPWVAPESATCLARVRLRTSGSDARPYGAIVQPLQGLPGPALTMVSLFALSATEREERARESVARETSLCALNNILAVISGHAQLALLEPGTDHALRISMETIRDAAERASGTLTRLLPEDEYPITGHHRSA